MSEKTPPQPKTPNPNNQPPKATEKPAAPAPDNKAENKVPSAEAAPKDGKTNPSPAASKIEEKAAPKPSAATPPPAQGNKTPPPAQGNKTPPPPPRATAEKKSGNGLAILALLCGLGGLGTGTYAFLQQAPLQSTAEAAEKGALAAEKRVVEAEKTLAALQQHVANAAQGLDKSQVSQLVAAALQDYAKSQPQLPNAEEIQARIDTQIAAAMPQSIKIEDVQSLIDQALLNSHSDTPIDFTQTIQAINQSNAQAQEALNNLSLRSEQIQQSLSQQADKLVADLKIIADSRPNPQPLISALTLADIAVQNGDYTVADKYLAQAENSFADFGLDSSAFADYKTRIGQLRGEIAGRADGFTITARIDRVIQSIPDWPFKNPAAAQQAIAEAPIQGETVAETAGNIGQKILNRTFKVVHNDEAGLTWIDAHKDLQTLIRENVRLDLAFARNALQLRHGDAYRRNIEQLVPRIEQYFNTEDAVVADALQQLKALAEQNSVSAPDIAALIAAVKQTAQQ